MSDYDNIDRKRSSDRDSRRNIDIKDEFANISGSKSSSHREDKDYKSSKHSSRHHHSSSYRSHRDEHRTSSSSSLTSKDENREKTASDDKPTIEGVHTKDTERSYRSSRSILKKLSQLDIDSLESASKIVKYHPTYHKIARMARTNFITVNNNGDVSSITNKNDTTMSSSSLSTGNRDRSREYVPQNTSAAILALLNKKPPTDVCTPGGTRVSSTSTASTEAAVINESSSKDTSQSTNDNKEKQQQRFKRRPNYFTSGLLMTVGGGAIFKGNNSVVSSSIPGCGYTSQLPIDYTSDKLDIMNINHNKVNDMIQKQNEQDSKLKKQALLKISSGINSGSGSNSTSTTSSSTTTLSQKDLMRSLQDGSLSSALDSTSIYSTMYCEPQDSTLPTDNIIISSQYKIIDTWRIYIQDLTTQTLIQHPHTQKPITYILNTQSCYRIGTNIHNNDIIIGYNNDTTASTNIDNNDHNSSENNTDDIRDQLDSHHAIIQFRKVPRQTHIIKEQYNISSSSTSNNNNDDDSIQYIIVPYIFDLHTNGGTYYIQKDNNNNMTKQKIEPSRYSQIMDSDIVQFGIYNKVFIFICDTQVINLHNNNNNRNTNNDVLLRDYDDTMGVINDF